MKQILWMWLLIGIGTTVMAQTNRLKGDGQIFWEESFDWEDASNERGWSLPEGWTIEDNSWDDTGYVWVWTKDSMQGPFSHRDGGYILNSTTRENGFLAIDLDNLNAYKPYTEMLFVNSSITLPEMDFSEHPSVIMSLQQMFKYFNAPRMVIEVSNDAGAHWAEFDLKMGTNSGTNTMNLPNDGVGDYMVNLSEVAAGQPAVTIKITWDGSMLYFWMLDDISFREGWDYDLRMNHSQVQAVNTETGESEGFFYMMPKTQIYPVGLLEGSVINYGDQQLSDVYFNATINKNGLEQFTASSDQIRYLFFGDAADTLRIDAQYTPVEFGHYEITMGMQATEEEQVPENNSLSYYFHVTDSVFARTPDVNEANESPWRSYYQYTHEGDYMGVEFNPITDCEASSISVYIARANLDADFRFALLEIEESNEGLEMVELIGSEMVRVDSSILEQGWITLPLELDGVGEKMEAGKRYIAAVQFWTYLTEEDLINRGNTFWIGSTQSYPASFDKQWLFESYSGTWTQGSNYNKMIRLNINNHENIIDGLPDVASALSLDQNYPNPFNSETLISYELAHTADVNVEIKDLMGRVISIYHQGLQTAGKHQLMISRDQLEAGMYTYTLKAGEKELSRRMVVR